jgi:YHS domain-containing protein
MKKVIAVLISVVVLGVGVAWAEEGTAQASAELKAQTVCPVMGAPFKKDIYVDHNGKRVYFCCKGCVNSFKADPEKYMNKMREQGAAPIDVPAE